MVISVDLDQLVDLDLHCVATDEPGHVIFKNVVRETNKRSDQPAHTHSLIRAFASRLNIL